MIHSKNNRSFDEKTTPNYSHFQATSDEEDGWITLTGAGQITQWKFPEKTKTCPVKSCLKHFGVHSDVVDHYRKRHFKDYIYCSLCDKPVSVRLFGDFNGHYLKMHPEAPLPNDFDGTSDHVQTESSHQV